MTLVGHMLVAILLIVSVDSVVIRTSTGLIRGVKHELDGVQFHRYLGIPYAEPPVGPLRFRAPVAKSPWNSVLNATSYGPSCPQDIQAVSKFYPDYMVKIPDRAREISEDCLTLNIFAPVTDTVTGLAVMFWIHGGSFETGQGSGYDPSALVTRGDVIVVTINYRLNIFGFLCTGDENAPGNYGLLDQQLALQWVHDNIESFGGDPTRVTLFGQSAGGASVTLHLFANKSRSLFQRAAAHSGYRHPSVYASGRGGWLGKRARDIGEEAGCDSGSTNSELVQCLRERPMEDVLAAGQAVSAAVASHIWFPVLDNNMISLTTSQLHLQHDFMVLLTSGDGSVILEVIDTYLRGMNAFNATLGLTEDEWDSWLTMTYSSLQVTKLATAFEYMDNTLPDPNFARMQAMTEMMMEQSFMLRLNPFLTLLPNSTTVHMGVFDHRCEANDRYPSLNQVPHGEEIPFLFGLPFNGSGMGAIFTDDERDLSGRVISYWSNFAKSGDPNVNPDDPPSVNLTYWPKYGDAEKYLLIQLADDTPGEAYRQDKVMFWTDYLPNLRRAAVESCPDQPDGSATPVCEEVFIGEGLGFKLTPDQAESLIEVFLFVIVALLALIIIVFGAVLGYKFKYKENKTHSKSNGLVKTNGSLQKNSAFEVNEAFYSESEDTKM